MKIKPTLIVEKTGMAARKGEKVIKSFECETTRTLHSVDSAGAYRSCTSKPETVSSADKA